MITISKKLQRSITCWRCSSNTFSTREYTTYGHQPYYTLFILWRQSWEDCKAKQKACYVGFFFWWNFGKDSKMSATQQRQGINSKSWQKLASLQSETVCPGEDRDQNLVQHTTIHRRYNLGTSLEQKYMNVIV